MRTKNKSTHFQLYSIQVYCHVHIHMVGGGMFTFWPSSLLAKSGICSTHTSLKKSPIPLHNCSHNFNFPLKSVRQPVRQTPSKYSHSYIQTTFPTQKQPKSAHQTRKYLYIIRKSPELPIKSKIFKFFTLSNRRQNSKIILWINTFFPSSPNPSRTHSSIVPKYGSHNYNRLSKPHHISNLQNHNSTSILTT